MTVTTLHDASSCAAVQPHRCRLVERPLGPGCEDTWGRPLFPAPDGWEGTIVRCDECGQHWQVQRVWQCWWVPISGRVARRIVRKLAKQEARR